MARADSVNSLVSELLSSGRAQANNAVKLLAVMSSCKKEVCLFVMSGRACNMSLGLGKAAVSLCAARNAAPMMWCINIRLRQGFAVLDKRKGSSIYFELHIPVPHFHTVSSPSTLFTASFSTCCPYAESPSVYPEGSNPWLKAVLRSFRTGRPARRG